MAKRYLSVDEAAEKLGISKDELKRLREKGEIRGFGDRGTFKFKEDDVYELARRLTPSSDSDVPMIDGDDDASVLDEDPAADGSGLDGAPSIIRRLSGAAPSGAAPSGDAGETAGSIFNDFRAGGDSDSDVRLDDDSGARLVMSDSDSDVQLSPSASDSGNLQPKPDSDSDVMLVSEEPDSDVHLAGDDGSGINLGLQSDSDVRLVSADSDSDVQLLDDALLTEPKSKIKKDSDSDVAVLPDSGFNLESAGSGIGKKSGGRSEGLSDLMEDSDIAPDQSSEILLTGLSGVNLLGPQSGVALDRVADSGVSLEKKAADDDSYLALFDSPSEEGGINLSGDSGIALHADGDGEEDDDGITLAETSGDSGISLEDDEDLQLTETLPGMKPSKSKKKPADEDDNMSDTMLEVPSVSADDQGAESDFEIGAVDGGSQGDTSVLLFDDEDETDDGGPPMVKKKTSDDEDEDFEFNEADEDTSDETEDVFAGDEAFDEESDFEGEEELEPVTKVVAGGPIEHPWGAGVVSSLAISSIVMIFCAMASIELVRSMWGHQGYSPANGWLIETLGGLFK